jgi:hypothetical protein
MSRFLNHSSRRLVAVAALVTATAIPSVVIATQSAAGAKTKNADSTTTIATVVSNGGKMH